VCAGVDLNAALTVGAKKNKIEGKVQQAGRDWCNVIFTINDMDTPQRRPSGEIPTKKTLTI
jgi:hypothetical protein